jgi:hypothetical protein
VKFFFQIFFGYRGSRSNLESDCKNLGCLVPLVWEEIDPAQTVHKPKLNLYIDEIKWIFTLATPPNFGITTSPKIDPMHMYASLSSSA